MSGFSLVLIEVLQIELHGCFFVGMSFIRLSNTQNYVGRYFIRKKMRDKSSEDIFLTYLTKKYYINNLLVKRCIFMYKYQ